MFAPGLQKLKLSFIEGLNRILLSSEPPETSKSCWPSRNGSATPKPKKRMNNNRPLIRYSQHRGTCAARSYRCGDLTTSPARCYPASTSRSKSKTLIPELGDGI